MLSASRMWSGIGSKAALIVAVCAGCSAAAPTSGLQTDVAGAKGTTSAPTLAAAGISGGAAGQTAAPVSSMRVTNTAPSGSSGSGGSTSVVAQSGSAGVTAKAGAGAPITGVAGNIGKAGSAGAAGAMVAMMGGGAGTGMTSSSEADCKVAPIPDDLRGRYENLDDKYYQKYASANGVILATGPSVADEAVVRYCRLLAEMHSNDKVRQAVIADKMWFTMIDEKEELSSLPQINRDYGTSLNARARGLGGLTPTICAEDSIMCLPGDKWNGDCICPHEAGHTLYSSGIQKVPELSSRLTKITSDARSSGRIANAYVWQDGNESGMMAWGVQVWYDCAINGMMGGYHPDINTRAELEKEMPDFYKFLSELLPAENKYEDCYAKP